MSGLEKKDYIPPKVELSDTEINFIKNYCQTLSNKIIEENKISFEYSCDISSINSVIDAKRKEILKQRKVILEKVFPNIADKGPANFSLYVFSLIKKHNVKEFQNLLKIKNINKVSDEDYKNLKQMFPDFISKLNFFGTKDEKVKKKVILNAIRQKLLFDIINDYTKNPKNIKYIRTLFVDENGKITFYKSQVFQKYMTAYHIFGDKKRLYYHGGFYTRGDIKKQQEKNKDKKLLYKMNAFYNAGGYLLTISEGEIIYDGADKALGKKGNKKAKEIFLKKYKGFLDKLDGKIKIDGINLANFIVSLIKIESIYGTTLNSPTGAKGMMQLTNIVFDDFRKRPKAFYETLKRNIKKIGIENISPVFVQKALYAIVTRHFNFKDKKCKKEFENYIDTIQNFLKNPEFQHVYFHKLNMLIGMTYFQSRFKETKKLSYPKILYSIKNSDKDLNHIVDMAKAFDEDVKDKITKNDIIKIINKIKTNSKLRILFYALRNYNGDTHKNGWKFEHRYYYALAILANAYKNAGEL